MRYFLSIFIFLTALLIGCGGSGDSSPVNPDSTSDYSVAQRYTMRIASPLSVSGQARDLQSYEAIDLIPINTGYPFDDQGSPPYFILDAELIDFDRESGILSVDFTVQNISGMPIYDPKLVVFFGETPGPFNEPEDNYRLETSDLLFNILWGYIPIPTPDLDQFQPAQRFKDSADPFLLPGIPETMTSEFSIPPPDDLNLTNYEPVYWSLMLVGTPGGIPLDPVDVEVGYASFKTILEEGETSPSDKLRFTVDNPSGLQLDVTAEFPEWGPIDLGLPSGDPFNPIYESLLPIDGVNLSATGSPYNIRITANAQGSLWKIQDDVLVYVVPEQEDFASEHHAGYYWVVYLDDSDSPGRYEFYAMNTVQRVPIKLTGTGGVFGQTFAGYKNFRNVSMGTLGFGGGPEDFYRLVFEAELIGNEFIYEGDVWEEEDSVPIFDPSDDTVKKDIDILGMEIKFTDGIISGIGAGVLVHETDLYYYHPWLKNGIPEGGDYTIPAIEREPEISPDGLYVVYERETREDAPGSGILTAYDVTRSYIIPFEFETQDIEEISTNTAAPFYASATEPSIGIKADGEYIVAYATDSQSDGTCIPGCGFIGLTNMGPHPISGVGIPSPNLYSSYTGSPYLEYFHNPYLSADASMVSFVRANQGFSNIVVSEVTLTLGFLNDNQFDSGPLFQYHPNVSGLVGEVNQNSWQDQHRVVYRRGNNKNAEIGLYFTNDIPPDLDDTDLDIDGLHMITDLDSDIWRDDRGHDSGADISADGLAVVWSGQRYSTGDIYFLDLQDLNDVDNVEELQDIVRLTYTGHAREPQVSNFIYLTEF